MKYSESLQKLLPFGYLFLVLMGILKESVFYYQIGINILNYATITDILISPVAALTAHPIIFIIVLVLILLCYAFPALLSKQIHKKWAQKLSSLENIEVLTEEAINTHFTKKFIQILALVLLTFFLGIGIGSGLGLKKRIKNDTLSYDRKIIYSSGESEQIFLVGSNSAYYFYLAKENKNIKIASAGAIKTIELTNNKMLK